MRTMDDVSGRRCRTKCCGSARARMPVPVRCTPRCIGFSELYPKANICLSDPPIYVGGAFGRGGNFETGFLWKSILHENRNSGCMPTGGNPRISRRRNRRRPTPIRTRFRCRFDSHGRRDRLLGFWDEKTTVAGHRMKAARTVAGEPDCSGHRANGRALPVRSLPERPGQELCSLSLITVALG